MKTLWLAIFPVIAIATSPMPAASEEDSGIVSEIRLGVLVHDAAIISERVEPTGPDANFEILFESPDFFKILWSPRPHFGVTLNPQGATSQAYLGLTWDWNATDLVFAEFSVGGSVHDGKLESLRAGPEEKPLGCRLLFRESLSLGYRLTDLHSLSVMVDHVSNGYLCDVNPGLDTVGLRWGYRF